MRIRMASMPLLSLRSFERYSRYVEEILLDVYEEIISAKEPILKESLLMLERNSYRYHLEEFLKIVINFLYFKDEKYLKAYINWRYRLYKSRDIHKKFLYKENALLEKIASHYIKDALNIEITKLHDYIAMLYDEAQDENSEYLAHKIPEYTLSLYTLLLQGEVDALESEIIKNTPTLQSFCQYFTKNISGVLFYIGEQWTLGGISVAQEHRMSALLKEILLKTLKNYEPISMKKEKFALSTIQSETHTLGREITVQILEKLGYEVVVLGSELSLKDICNTLYEFRIHHILFIATLPTNLLNVAQYIQVTHKEPLLENVQYYAAGGALKTLTNPCESLECDLFFESFEDLYEKFA